MQDSPQLARFRLMERIGDASPRVDNVGGAVVSALDALGLARSQIEGKQIGVATGSRGIANLREIVRAACQWLMSRGARPFVFPAMGSHGGATDEGQLRVLEEYGITPDGVGAEILSSAEAVLAGETPEGFPVYMDRHAAQSDGVLVINRVKPHTHFIGKIESGLIKMIAIGMGKPRGAQECHRLIVRHGFELVVRSIASTQVANGKILAGLAIVENGRHETAAIRGARSGELAAIEEEMLVLAKELFPKIPFEHLHLLVVDEIGKDVSGTGIDPKAIGRLEKIGSPGNNPRIELIYARDLTDKTAGNALGVGLADLIHERLYRRLDVEKTYVNARTSLNPWVVRVPMRFPSDHEALDFAVRALGSPVPLEQRLVWIRNTLTLDRILVSEAVATEAGSLAGWRVATEAHSLAFDHEGNVGVQTLTHEPTAP